MVFSWYAHHLTTLSHCDRPGLTVTWITTLLLFDTFLRSSHRMGTHYWYIAQVTDFKIDNKGIWVCDCTFKAIAIEDWRSVNGISGVISGWVALIWVWRRPNCIRDSARQPRLPGSHLTNGISHVIKFDGKFVLLQFDPIATILHISRQNSYRNTSKIL